MHSSKIRIKKKERPKIKNIVRMIRSAFTIFAHPFRPFNEKISQEIKKGKTLFDKMNLSLGNKRALSSCQFHGKLFFRVRIIIFCSPKEMDDPSRSSGYG
jgi:hypothetical protein